MRYITDWEPVSTRRYAKAQQNESKYWRKRDAAQLTLSAQYHFYAGYYEWTKQRGLLNPFCISPDRPQNFQIPVSDIEGKEILDIGCGPTSSTLSLVHCARVHVLDPLIPLYQQIQPFGWESFSSVSSAGGEELPFERESFHFVHSRNALDHVRDAGKILSEITRVLVPGGQLLFACDVRGKHGGGPSHPYLWTLDALESGIFRRFKPVTPVTLWDHTSNSLLSRAQAETRVARWVCRLRLE